MIALTTTLLLTLSPGGAEPSASSGDIDAGSVLISLIEQVEVPAGDAGVLSALHVREGELVEEGQLLAQIDDTEARLAVEQAGAARDIAVRQAENDVEVRFARKNAEVAQTELQRALDSVASFARSVSQSEIDRLRLAAERAVLGVEQAEFDLEIYHLTSRQKKSEHAAAEHLLKRRRIESPLAGMVVQINARRGEWVKPGDSVIRVLRVDRLRAEGFLPADRDDGTLVGRKVRLTIDLPGRPGAVFDGEVVFVSPEVNPVNHQVRIWAEIDNHDLLLRPGLQAQMTISAKSD